MFDKQAKTIEDIKKAKNIRVHEGTFHMDDMMCIALIKKINPNIGIIRDRDNIPEDTTDIICDCYGGFFDHHFSDLNDIKKRQSGKPMASMGCLMQVVGEEIFGQEWKEIDENFISKFDAADLGLKDDFLSCNINKLNPAYKRNEIEEEQINKAINICTEIIDSFNCKEKEPKEINNYLSKYFKNKGLEGNLNDNFVEYFGTHTEKLEREFLDKDSTINFLLSGLKEEKAQKFLFEILNTEKRMYEVKKEIDEELNKVREDSIKENKEFAVFDIYPGSVSIFSDTPIKFVIFKQTGSEKYCINTIPNEEKVEEGFPIPKVPFPKEFSGKAIILEKEINITLPKIINILHRKENFNLEELSKEFSDLLNRPIKIDSIEELNSFKNNILKELEDKKILLNEFDKRGLEFVHPGQFFVQTKDKESAINFVVEILSNDKYIQKCAVEQINEYIDSHNLNPELKNIFIEKNLTTKYIKYISKAIKEDFTEEELLLLQKSKKTSHEISENVFNCIKENMSNTFIREIIENDLSSESINILLQDFKDNKSEDYLREEIKLLKISDKYIDLDTNIPELNRQLESDINKISKNLSDEVKDSKIYKFLVSKTKEIEINEL